MPNAGFFYILEYIVDYMEVFFMNKSFFGRCALILSTLAVLSPAAPLKGMDASAGDAQSGSGWFNTAIASVVLAPLAGYGYLYRKHYNELQLIERQLDQSTSANARESNFLFATWRSTEKNTPKSEQLWQDAYALAGDNSVVKLLMHDANCPDRVYVYDEKGVRINPSEVILPAIKQAIAREKQLLENQLALVAPYTDVPCMIVQQLAPGESSSLTAHELALSYASKLQEKDLVEKIKAVEEQIKVSSKLKSIVYCGGWLPTSWSVAPCYQKASRLYFKLFLAYARLRALDEVVNGEVQSDDD